MLGTLDLITDFKHKQWKSLTKLPDLDCHLRGGGDEDVGAEVVPGDGPHRGQVAGETEQRGGAVVQSAVVQVAALRPNKIRVLGIQSCNDDIEVNCLLTLSDGQILSTVPPSCRASLP